MLAVPIWSFASDHNDASADDDALFSVSTHGKTSIFSASRMCGTERAMIRMDGRRRFVSPANPFLPSNDKQFSSAVISLCVSR